MKKHLTELAVQRIKTPKEGTVEYFDLGYPGLSLRVGHGGAKSFQQFYRVDGKLVRESFGRWPAISLAAARAKWRETREKLANGELVTREAKSHALSFDRAAEDWLKRDQSQNKASTLYQAIRTVEAELLPAWRSKRVDQITKADVIALLDSIMDRGAPIMAKRVQRIVRRFFHWCLERDIVKVDPTVGLPRIANGKTRERLLSAQELAKIWAETDCIGPFGAAVRLLILTGARREEIGQLRWSEIDGDVIHLKGHRTKNGEPHDIPLSAPARELLDSIPRLGAFVFTFSGTKPINGWSRPKAKLDTVSGVSDWHVHDVRRTVATGLEKLGIKLQVTEAILGHTSGSRAGIVGVYQRHDYAEEKRAALEAWGAYVAALVRQ